MNGIAYLDASALVKLVVPEPESAALQAAIARRWGHAVASEILSIEVHRAAIRIGGDAAAVAARRLLSVGLLPLTQTIRTRAQRIGPSELRALDAIHLATALSVQEQVDVLLTYDVRLAAAARAAGIPVEAPA
jgi:predicted nucleic acid-binding protein